MEKNKEGFSRFFNIVKSTLGLNLAAIILTILASRTQGKNEIAYRVIDLFKNKNTNHIVNQYNISNVNLINEIGLFSDKFIKLLNDKSLETIANGKQTKSIDLNNQEIIDLLGPNIAGITINFKGESGTTIHINRFAWNDQRKTLPQSEHLGNISFINGPTNEMEKENLIDKLNNGNLNELDGFEVTFFPVNDVSVTYSLNPDGSFRLLLSTTRQFSEPATITFDKNGEIITKYSSDDEKIQEIINPPTPSPTPTVTPTNAQPPQATSTP